MDAIRHTAKLGLIVGAVLIVPALLVILYTRARRRWSSQSSARAAGI